VRIVFAEDQALLRVGLTRVLADLGFEVVEVDNGPALVAALADPTADAAVVDVRLPPSQTTEGLAAAIAAREARPGFPVLVLSAMVEPEYARRLLADGTGAVGYLLKDRVTDLDQFVTAFRQVVAGGTVLDPEVVATMLQQPAKLGPVGRLTPREQEVLAAMAEGRSNAAIAARLFVSEKAVGKHTNSIFTKLDLPIAPDDNRRVLAVLAWLQK
jgi:DNA-binding NarL/FixJ family response regulator